MSVISNWFVEMDFLECTLKVLAELAPALAILCWPLEVLAIRILYPVALVLGMMLSDTLVEVRKLQLLKGKKFSADIIRVLVIRSLYMFFPRKYTDPKLVTIIYIGFLVSDLCLLFACIMEKENLNDVVVPTTPVPTSEEVKTQPDK